MKRLLYRIFNIKHECRFDEQETILDGYKESLYNIYSKQGIVPFAWDKVKDYSPRCYYCNRKFSEIVKEFKQDGE